MDFIRKQHPLQTKGKRKPRSSCCGAVMKRVKKKSPLRFLFLLHRMAELRYVLKSKAMALSSQFFISFSLSQSRYRELRPFDVIVLHYIVGPLHAAFLVKRHSAFVGDQIDRDVLFTAGQLMGGFYQAFADAPAGIIPVHPQIGDVEPIAAPQSVPWGTGSQGRYA